MVLHVSHKPRPVLHAARGFMFQVWLGGSVDGGSPATASAESRHGDGGSDSSEEGVHCAGGNVFRYDEDFNHEPCQRNGHRAHWAVASGVLLGLDKGSVNNEHAQPDPTLPWLYLANSHVPCPIKDTSATEVYVLTKQGKSLRYQLWSLDSVAQSNGQLRTMGQLRANDGIQYVVPEGGVEAGLAGQAVLLHTKTLGQEPK
ncbi:hypothetical protein GOODEAATRI_013157 [Goodea atripinnis]|uniref:Actin maturation protease n=1 Tax=Goodea atripinnis TaxID=208336 RepID=A0ABV0PDT0_9TELE